MQVPASAEDRREHGPRRGASRTRSCSTPPSQELDADHGPQGGAHARRRSRIANFKVRKGKEIGVMVTLRGDVMYEFLDRLVNVAMPRIKDFRGAQPERVRRARQLLPRGDRADHLPRDRLRQDRAGQRHEHRDRHDGADRRGGPQPPRPHGHALPEITGDEQAWHARQRSRRATPEPKYSTRRTNRCKVCGRQRGYMRKFQHVPHLFPQPRQRRKDSWRHEVELVGEGWHEPVRSGRGHADEDPKRVPGTLRERRHPDLEAEAGDHQDPEERGLHQDLQEGHPGRPEPHPHLPEVRRGQRRRSSTA